MSGFRIAIGLAAAWLVAGCGGDSGPPRPLEIGLRGQDGSFVPLAENDEVAIVLGANGLNMIVPSLRASDIDPHAPDPTVEIEIGGTLMAADIEGSRVDMTDDGVGYVLWDIRTPFQTELCCYNCSAGLVNARIQDASGQAFEGSVTVTFERGGCPDPAVCCQNVDVCPEPEQAKLCQ